MLTYLTKVLLVIARFLLSSIAWNSVLPLLTTNQFISKVTDLLGVHKLIK